MLAFLMITLNFWQSILFGVIKALGLLQHTLYINFISMICIMYLPILSTVNPTLYLYNGDQAPKSLVCSR